MIIVCILYVQNSETRQAIPDEEPKVLIRRAIANISKLAELSPKLSALASAENGNDSEAITAVKALVEVTVQQGCEWVSSIG